jgi:hypothetical protein
MTAEQFAKQCTIPFEHPGSVEEIDTNVTQPQLQQRERQYQLDVAYIKEFAQMETVIFNQVTSREAIDEEYLVAYLDGITGNFTCTIPELLMYLIDTYIYISKEELEMKRAKVVALEYSAGQPMDTVLQQVNNFTNLAELASNDILEAQKIAMAKVIIVKAGTYLDYITEWNRKLAANKTWSNFMTFFRQAHKELRESRPMLNDISMEAHIMEQEKDDLQQAIIQLQLQSQEHILKTNLGQNQKQMNKMMEQMMKTLVEKQTSQPSCKNYHI